MSDFLYPGHPDVPTDPDILGVYRDRIMYEPREGRMLGAAIDMATWLQMIASRRDDDLVTPVELAAWVLTDLGERATPLRDEGVPCG